VTTAEAVESDRRSPSPRQAPRVSANADAATRATPAAPSPAVAPRSHGAGVFRKLAAPTPTSVMMTSPGSWNSRPVSMPPRVPFLMIPILF
jgi:hypothetical protein